MFVSDGMLRTAAKRFIAQAPEGTRCQALIEVCPLCCLRIFLILCQHLEEEFQTSLPHRLAVIKAVYRAETLTSPQFPRSPAKLLSPGVKGNSIKVRILAEPRYCVAKSLNFQAPRRKLRQPDMALDVEDESDNQEAPTPAPQFSQSHSIITPISVPVDPMLSQVSAASTAPPTSQHSGNEKQTLETTVRHYGSTCFENTHQICCVYSVSDASIAFFV